MAGTGRQSVAIIGGGVSGLSAAHELAHDFDVTVIERRPACGGKAASAPDGDLPAEHGFRFFPGFYQHVTQTLKEIPATGGGTVFEHLQALDCSVMAAAPTEDGSTERRCCRRWRSSRHWLVTPLPTSTSRPTLLQHLKGMRTFCDEMPKLRECAAFIGVLARLAGACEPRRERELENQNWLELVESANPARSRSKNYQRLFAIGLTRSFVATRAEEMNARTGGEILLQLLYDCYFGPPERCPADRVLDGPTSTVWIDPWIKDLQRRGVHVEPNLEATSIETDRKRVTGVTVHNRTLPPKDPSVDQRREFDWYVLAVPCEVLKRLLVTSPSLREADSELAKVFKLKTRWMNGIVFGVKQALDPPLPPAHILCLDSQWALTLLDQMKVWAAEHCDPVQKHWQALLSVDISDWDSPGDRQLPAKWQPSHKAFVADVWTQLRAHLPQLPEKPPQRYALDVNIGWSPLRTPEDLDPLPYKHTNDEPLLVNTVGSWENRPTAETALKNLFIAGDFPQTFTNFASMEAANEAAKRAVNALRRAAGHPTFLEIPPLQDPKQWWFAVPQRWARRADRVIFWSKLPIRTPFRLPVIAWIVLGLLNKALGGSRRETAGDPK